MAGGIVEIEKKVLEVIHGVAVCEGIYDRPHEKRDKDADCPAPEEIRGTATERELKVAGCYHEERDAAAYE